jgi:hypothetical protein
MSITSVRELDYLFLTSPVCNRIASDLDFKDHTVLDDYSWMKSNPTTQIGICYYTTIPDALTITKV